MSKKTTKSGSGLTSIPGGKAGSGATGNRAGKGGGGNGRGPTHPDGNTAGGAANASGTNVIDFTSVRAQRSLDNRRTFERFFLQHMVDAYCEIDGGQKQLPLEIVEVSESGCSFRLPADKAEVLPRDTAGALLPIHARFYFSRDSYLRIGLFVVNQARDISTGQGHKIRFGCRVDETFASTEAYRQFVRFMEQFATHAARDGKQVSAY